MNRNVWNCLMVLALCGFATSAINCRQGQKIETQEQKIERLEKQLQTINIKINQKEVSK